MKKTKLFPAVIMLLGMLWVLTLAVSAGRIDGVDFKIPAPISNTTVASYQSAYKYNTIKYDSFEEYVTQVMEGNWAGYDKARHDYTGTCGDDIVIEEIRWYKGINITPMASTEKFVPTGTYRIEIDWYSNELDTGDSTIRLGNQIFSGMNFSVYDVEINGGSTTTKQRDADQTEDKKRCYTTSAIISPRSVTVDIVRTADYADIRYMNVSWMERFDEENTIETFASNQPVIFKFKNLSRPGFISGAVVEYTFNSGEVITDTFTGAAGNSYGTGSYNASTVTLTLTLPETTYNKADYVKRVKVSPLWVAAEVTGIEMIREGGSEEEVTEYEPNRNTRYVLEELVPYTLKAYLRIPKVLIDHPDYSVDLYYTETYTIEGEKTPYTTYVDRIDDFNQLTKLNEDDKFIYYAYAIENIGAYNNTVIECNFRLRMNDDRYVLASYDNVVRFYCNDSYDMKITKFMVGGFNHMNIYGEFPSSDYWDAYVVNRFELGIDNDLYSAIPQNLRMFGAGLKRGQGIWKIEVVYNDAPSTPLNPWSLYSNGEINWANNGHTVFNYNPTTYEPVVPYLNGKPGQYSYLHITYNMTRTEQYGVYDDTLYPLIDETLKIYYDSDAQKPGMYSSMVENVTVYKSSQKYGTYTEKLKSERVDREEDSVTRVNVEDENSQDFYKVHFEVNVPSMYGTYMVGGGYKVRYAVLVNGSAADYDDDQYNPAGVHYLNELSRANIYCTLPNSISERKERYEVTLKMFVVDPNGKDINDGEPVEVATVIIEHKPKHSITLDYGNYNSLTLRAYACEDPDKYSWIMVNTSDPADENYGVYEGSSVKLTVSNPDDEQPFLYWKLTKKDGTLWKKIWGAGVEHSSVNDYKDAIFEMPDCDLIVKPVFLDNYTHLVTDNGMVVNYSRTVDGVTTLKGSERVMSGENLHLEDNVAVSVTAEWILNSPNQDGVEIAAKAIIYRNGMYDNKYKLTWSDCISEPNKVQRTGGGLYYLTLNGGMPYGKEEDIYSVFEIYVYDDEQDKWVYVTTDEVFGSCTIIADCSTVLFNYDETNSNAAVSLPNGYYMTNSGNISKGEPSETMTGYAYNKDGRLMLNNFSYSGRGEIRAVDAKGNPVKLDIRLSGDNVIETELGGFYAGGEINLKGPGALTIDTAGAAFTCTNFQCINIDLDITADTCFDFTGDESTMKLGGGSYPTRLRANGSKGILGLSKMILNGADVLIQTDEGYILNGYMEALPQIEGYTIAYSNTKDGLTADGGNNVVVYKEGDTGLRSTANKYFAVRPNGVNLRCELSFRDHTPDSVSVKMYPTDDPRDFRYLTYDTLLNDDGVAEIVISNVSAGTYTLEISADGCDTVIKTVEIDKLGTTVSVTLSKKTTRTITGSITSSGENNGIVIELYREDKLMHTAEISEDGKSYTITGVALGDYTLRISKPNHVTREYAITVQ